MNLQFRNPVGIFFRVLKCSLQTYIMVVQTCSHHKSPSRGTVTPRQPKPRGAPPPDPISTKKRYILVEHILFCFSCYFRKIKKIPWSCWGFPQQRLIGFWAICVGGDFQRCRQPKNRIENGLFLRVLWVQDTYDPKPKKVISDCGNEDIFLSLWVSVCGLKRGVWAA